MICLNVDKLVGGRILVGMSDWEDDCDDCCGDYCEDTQYETHFNTS